MQFILLALSLFILCCCTHDVYNMNVKKTTHAAIENELKANCEKECEIDICWWENKNLVVCKINISALGGIDTRKVLEKTASRLAQENMLVGFCGQESAAPALVGAVVGGMIGGITGSSNVYWATTGVGKENVSYPNQDEMDEACASDPTQRNKEKF